MSTTTICLRLLLNGTGKIRVQTLISYTIFNEGSMDAPEGKAMLRKFDVFFFLFFRHFPPFSACYVGDLLTAAMCRSIVVLFYFICFCTYVLFYSVFINNNRAG